MNRPSQGNITLQGTSPRALPLRDAHINGGMTHEKILCFGIACDFLT